VNQKRVIEFVETVGLIVVGAMLIFLTPLVLRTVGIILVGIFAVAHEVMDLAVNHYKWGDRSWTEIVGRYGMVILVGGMVLPVIYFLARIMNGESVLFWLVLTFVFAVLGHVYIN